MLFYILLIAAAVGAGIVLGDADRLIHQLLGCDTAAGGGIVANDKNCLFKNTGIGGVHHDDPTGNTFDQEYALLLLLTVGKYSMAGTGRRYTVRRR